MEPIDLELINEVRLNLRRVSSALDEEIEADINAAYADLQRVGINIADSKKPLLVKGKIVLILLTPKTSLSFMSSRRCITSS